MIISLPPQHVRSELCLSFWSEDTVNTDLMWQLSSFLMWHIKKNTSALNFFYLFVLWSVHPSCQGSVGAGLPSPRCTFYFPFIFLSSRAARPDGDQHGIINYNYMYRGQHSIALMDVSYLTERPTLLLTTTPTASSAFRFEFNWTFG